MPATWLLTKPRHKVYSPLSPATFSLQIDHPHLPIKLVNFLPSLFTFLCFDTLTKFPSSSLHSSPPSIRENINQRFMRNEVKQRENSLVVSGLPKSNNEDLNMLICSVATALKVTLWLSQESTSLQL